jgi:hypothetical protein
VLEQTAGRVVGVAPGDRPAGRNLLGFSRPIAPNPCRGIARFAVSVPMAASVELSVLDPAGRLTAILHRGTLEAGEHAFQWEGLTRQGRPAGSGLYFVRFRCGGAAQVRRLLLVR